MRTVTLILLLMLPARPTPAPGAVVCRLLVSLHLLQVWFHLSDEACEDAVLDSRATRRFVGIDMTPGQVPDATTLPEFRHLLEGEGLGEGMLAELVSIPGERGIIMRGGSIVDATLAGSPSPARNRERSRDPEAHQAKKGNNWHFGYKAHAGVDAGTGLARGGGHRRERVGRGSGAVAAAPRRRVLLR